MLPALADMAVFIKRKGWKEKLKREPKKRAVSQGQYQHIKHTFEPVYNGESKILVLGSLPSVKSREEGFYYGHPRNRFWSVLSGILKCPVPQTVEEKKQMLLGHQVAIYDVILECDIIGSSDSSIRDVVPADIGGILENSKVGRIFANGKTAAKLYQRYIEPETGIPIIELPSTSPANAAYGLERLLQVWGQVIGEV